jgi:hypothetical protein
MLDNHSISEMASKIASKLPKFTGIIIRLESLPFNYFALDTSCCSGGCGLCSGGVLKHFSTKEILI